MVFSVGKDRTTVSSYRVSELKTNRSDMSLLWMRCVVVRCVPRVARESRALSSARCEVGGLH
jgi:hypothetical protein